MAQLLKEQVGDREHSVGKKDSLTPVLKWYFSKSLSKIKQVFFNEIYAKILIGKPFHLIGKISN